MRELGVLARCLGRPGDLVARDALVARWPDAPAQALHGDSHERNVLVTPTGPVWDDFEDAWRGPVGWDVAGAGDPLPYPAADVPFWLELRELYGACWARCATFTEPEHSRAPDRGRARATIRGVQGLVLVVEDDRAIAELVSLYLRRDGFGVHVEADGHAALAAVRRLKPVAVLLDVGLPGLDGVQVCRALRAAGDWTPVLFVTARDDEVDRVLGLELGADDYVTKPFSPRELVARVRTVLRRGVPQVDPVRVVGDVRLDGDRRRVWVGGAEVALTSTEFELLAHLMRHPGRVFARERLLSAVWGYAAVAGTRTVDVHVAQLRAKLGGSSPIRTVRGVGYSVEAS